MPSLTALLPGAGYALDYGGSALRTDDPEEHLDRPGWIDGDLGRDGGHVLWDAYAEPPDPTLPRAAFDAAVLAAARRLDRGEPGPPRSALPAEQDPRLVPAHPVQPRALSLYVNRAGGGQPGVRTTLDVQPGRELRVQATLDTPERYTLSATVRAPALPEGAQGEVTAPLAVDYRLLGPGLAAADTATSEARWLVDGDRVVLLAPGGTLVDRPTDAGDVHLGWFRED
ncbi:MAG: hypothetical protein R3F59_01325 [Myxococcota bacterium]